MEFEAEILGGTDFKKVGRDYQKIVLKVDVGEKDFTKLLLSERVKIAF